ncbi:fibroblast growth factor 17 isoform X2 [Macrosteles quadrilineatus]|uniref:fibroblast growth factor 17 isoform X2 n=1 Tax=Macrosteles quadrilineatus TaxID=74068 RepID=UPI0023E2B38B|nr:fibroblast growth factor 17 isoform X2 [Macrosteles quadrilineatus]
MRLTLYTLPKLAVSAKLLCLLMVVICGAVPSMVRSVRLYNDCSSSQVRVDMKGRVLADDVDIPDRFRNLTIRSLDFSVKLTIFAEESKRFLCFNHKWKLVGSKRFRGSMCQFYEIMVQTGYNRFRSVVDETRYIGFNRKGKPLRGTSTPHNPKCLNFIKLDQKFNIENHNKILAGGGGGGGGAYNDSADSVLRKSPFSKLWRTTTPRIRHNNHHRKFP